MPNQVFRFTVDSIREWIFSDSICMSSTLNATQWTIDCAYIGHCAIKTPNFEANVFSVLVIHAITGVFVFHGYDTRSELANWVAALSEVNHVHIYFTTSNILGISTDTITLCCSSAQIEARLLQVQNGISRIQGSALSLTSHVQKVAVAYLDPHCTFAENTSSVSISLCSLKHNPIVRDDSRGICFTTHNWHRERISKKTEDSTECSNEPNKKDGKEKTNRILTTLSLWREAIQGLLQKLFATLGAKIAWFMTMYRDQSSEEWWIQIQPISFTVQKQGNSHSIQNTSRIAKPTDSEESITNLLIPDEISKHKHCCGDFFLRQTFPYCIYACL